MKFIQRFLSVLKRILEEAVNVVEDTAKKVKEKIKGKKPTEEQEKKVDVLLNEFKEEELSESQIRKLLEGRFVKSFSHKEKEEKDRFFLSSILSMIILIAVAYFLYLNNKVLAIFWVFILIPISIPIIAKYLIYKWGKPYRYNFYFILVFMFTVSLILLFAPSISLRPPTDEIYIILFLCLLGFGFFGNLIGESVGESIGKKVNVEEFDFLVFTASDKIAVIENLLYEFISQHFKIKESIFYDAGENDDEVGKIYKLSGYRRLLLIYSDKKLALSIFRQNGKNIDKDSLTENGLKRLKFLFTNVLNLEEADDVTVKEMRTIIHSTLDKYCKSPKFVEFLLDMKQEKGRQIIGLVIIIPFLIGGYVKRGLLPDFIAQNFPPLILSIIFIAVLNYFGLLPKKENLGGLIS